MKTSIKILALFLIVTSVFCCANLNRQEIDLIIIKGNIKGTDSAMLYLKQINPISYNSTSILDSAEIKSNGDFIFEVNNSVPLLLNISKHESEHPVHEVLRKDPDKYYYSYCALFYIPEPTFYLTENRNIEIDWTVSELLDSFNFDPITKINQEVFYDFYLKEKLSEGLYQDDGHYKPMDSKTAWDEIQRAINVAQKNYGIDENNFENEFNSYLNTEIVMGAMNLYINWYESMNSDELIEAFESGEIPKLYENAIDMYKSATWNEQSVEYYKMTERYIVFNMNKLKKEFESYYPFSEGKLLMAKSLLRPAIAEKYINNIN